MSYVTLQKLIGLHVQLRKSLTETTYLATTEGINEFSVNVNSQQVSQIWWSLFDPSFSYQNVDIFSIF